MNKKGVTLIELLVVFVVIAIGATLMVPGLNRWLPKYRLRSATRDIASTMRTAQLRAISNNLNYQVVFTPAGGTYILQRNSGGLVTNEDATQTVPTGITFATTFLGDTVIFNPNSTATPGSVTVSNAESQRTITVLSSNGRVLVP
jgi:prepilin-type N-terminal cleavage/methylation domain-containing protein